MTLLWLCIQLNHNDLVNLGTSPGPHLSDSFIKKNLFLPLLLWRTIIWVCFSSLSTCTASVREERRAHMKLFPAANQQLTTSQTLMGCASDLFLLIGAYLPPANTLPLMMIIKSFKIIYDNIQNVSLVHWALAHYVVLHENYLASSVNTKPFMAKK